MKNKAMVTVKHRQKKAGLKKPVETKTETLKKVLKQESSPKKLVPAPEITVQKKIKYVMPTKAVTDQIVTACLNALDKLDSHNKKKNVIFGDETQIFMEIRCIKVLHSKGNLKFILPHSTVASSGEVCLITPDIKKGKKPDHEPTIDRWEEMLREANVTSVKTILPMRQLRVEYDQYELKRRLLTQHDFIMVDTRVLNHVSHVLGKMFFKKHNMLVPVKVNEKDIKKSIDRGLRTVVLHLSEGQTSTILVGHTAMPKDFVKENIMSLIKQFKEKFPGGERNIRSLSIKLPLSLSIPIYLTLRPTNTVKTMKIKQKKPKSYQDYEGELTTQLDSTVRVAPDGTVHVKRNLNKTHDSDMEEEISENEEDDKNNDE